MTTLIVEIKEEGIKINLSSDPGLPGRTDIGPRIAEIINELGLRWWALTDYGEIEDDLEAAKWENIHTVYLPNPDKKLQGWPQKHAQIINNRLA